MSRNDSIIEHRVDTVEILRQAYEQKDYKRFFEWFPDSFCRFNDIYGYKEERTVPAMPLYDESYQHMSFLFSKQLESDSIHLSKLFAIAKTASWDADAIAYFQDGLLNLILKEPDRVAAYLQKQSKKELICFWEFILDSPFPLESDCKRYATNIYKKINAVSPIMGKMIREANALK